MICNLKSYHEIKLFVFVCCSSLFLYLKRCTFILELFFSFLLQPLWIADSWYIGYCHYEFSQQLDFVDFFPRHFQCFLKIHYKNYSWFVSAQTIWGTRERAEKRQKNLNSHHDTNIRFMMQISLECYISE